MLLLLYYAYKTKEVQAEIIISIIQIVAGTKNPKKK